MVDMSNNGGVPIPRIDAATAVQLGGGAAANFMGKFSGPAQIFFDMVAGDMQKSAIENNSAAALGETAEIAKVDSAAYKNFSDDLEEKMPGETLKRSLASVAGGALGALLLAPIPFGPLIGAVVGGFVGNMVADKYLASKRYDFGEFARSLDASSAAGALTGEQVAVAQIIGLENKAQRHAIYETYGFKSSGDLVEALEKGDPRITEMMHDQDALIRQTLALKNTAVFNAQTGRNLTASEMLAGYYNSPAAVDPVTGLQGANLLSGNSVGGSVMQLNMMLAQFEQQQAAMNMPPNPGDLPNLKAQQLTRQ